MDVNRSGEMEVFARVIETGSFSAAARKLRLTPSAVAKLVTRLEARLGVRLLHRSTRSLTPTAEGEAFNDSAAAILADLDEAESAVSAHATPRGRLRVNASVPFGNGVLVPLLPEFLKHNPGISIDLSLTDDVVDILAERADVAIRHGPLRDSRLTARKLGTSRRLVVASPDYLKRHGRPKRPEDLAGHNCLNFNFRISFYDWPFAVGAERRSLPVSGNLQANNGDTLRQLVLAGLGIARLGAFNLAADLKAKRLVPLLQEFESGETEDIHAIFVGRGHMPLRVRAFIDFLVERVRVA
ncbi:MAG TPA: LysR family transcriptional regulator [Dongiaceae bacterium]|jgi:DNA-binding transcriptional LysR family regulator|nr:LysR family transcriptional regulator [Dongiaceae bacterium]